MSPARKRGRGEGGEGERWRGKREEEREGEGKEGRVFSEQETLFLQKSTTTPDSSQRSEIIMSHY